jgi:hypothetical protein
MTSSIGRILSAFNCCRPKVDDCERPAVSSRGSTPSVHSSVSGLTPLSSVDRASTAGAGLQPGSVHSDVSGLTPRTSVDRASTAAADSHAGSLQLSSSGTSTPSLRPQRRPRAASLPGASAPSYPALRRRSLHDALLPPPVAGHHDRWRTDQRTELAVPPVLPVVTTDSQRWRTDGSSAGAQRLAQHLADGKAVTAKLSSDELGMLRGYTNHDYKHGNAAIRSGTQSAQPFTQLVDKLSASGLAVQGPVFRSVRDHRIVQEGGLYVDAAPGSASCSPDFAVKLARLNSSPKLQAVVLHLFGARAANVSGAAVKGNEKEYEALVRPHEPFDVLLKAFDSKAGIYKAVLARVPDEAPP